jgi:hypothetical protein
MTRATQLQLIANCLVNSQHAEHVAPHRDVGISRRITNQVHPMLCSAEQDIDPIRRLEKANFVCIVASHK